MPSTNRNYPSDPFVQNLKRCLLVGAAAIAGILLFSHNVRAANNPVPFVDIVSPVSITPGSTGVVLTVRGTGFVAASKVIWNGTTLTTTFLSAQNLTAAVPDAFVAAVGLGSVIVSSPTPGGGKSNVTYVPVAAHELTTSFSSTPTSSLSVGTMPQGLLTADFNTDGKLDLAVANNGDGTVSILLGDGHGGFTTKSTPSAGAGANWVATGDFNEDGIPDLAVANSNDGTVSILLGVGDGTFTLNSSPAVGSGPFALTAGDFNGDGHLDLAVSNSSDNTVTILLGAGNGTFTNTLTLTVGNVPEQIVAGDFNEDGKLDLAVSNETDATVSVLIGIGDGSFQSQATFSTGGSGAPIGLIAADYNGDGHLDLAAVNLGDVGILLGNGLGSFTLHSNPSSGSSDLIAGVTGDYNGDGKLDLVVSDGASSQAFFFPGNGDGTFGTKITYTTAAGSFGVATADFNGDGALDLAIANGTANNVSIFLQLLPVSLNPISLSFGNQPVTTASASQDVILSNTSGSALTITSIGFTGADSGDFSQTNSCGISVANNSTCMIPVTFTPTASGSRVATLQIVDSASNSPQTLAVSGVGTAAPSITSADNAPFTIGSAGTFTVTTTGFPLPTVNKSGSLPSGVTFTDNGDGTATLAGTPAIGSGGSYLLTITAHNGIGSDALQTFTLTVASPPSIAQVFGAPSIPVNATTSLTFTISNPNSGASLTGVAFTDSLPSGLIVATPNGLSGTCTGTATAVSGSSTVSLSAATLAATASCTVSLNVQGTIIGVRTNSVTISSTEGGTGNTSVASVTVIKSDTTTAVVSSANPSVFGQSVSFTATVSPVAPGAGTATGTVTFLDGGSPVGTGTLSGGIATFATSALAIGNHTLTTSYGGDGNFNGSTGSLTGNPQVVNKTNSTTVVTSSQNPSVFGQSVIFTATVSPVAPGTGTSTGTVTFLDGGSPVGTGTLSGGIATFATSALAIGNHTLTTSYGGDGNFNGSTGSLTGNPQVVNKTNSTTVVTSSQNPSVFGQSVIFTATVSPVAPGTGTATGTVTFLDGGSPVGTGTLSGGIATFATSALAIGNHTLTTSYGGDGNFNGSTGSLTGNPQVVNKTNSTTVVTSSQNPSVFGQSVIFTATVSPVAPGTGTPTGTVTFLDGGSPIGTGTLSAGVATLTTTLAAGNHTLTTTYAGDADFIGSTGALTGNPQVVVTPPVLAATFNPATISLNGTSVLNFTLTNPAANTVALTGVAFTDSLPAGLVISTPNGLSNTCAGTATAVAGSTSFSLTAAGIAVNSSCTFVLNITGTAPGQYTNTSGAVSATNGGAGNTASASLTVASPPTIAKAFGAAAIPLNGATSLTFTVTNPNSAVALTGIAFTDNLPPGLIVATPNNLANTCGGATGAVAGSSVASLSAGTLAASASCTISLNVSGASAGVKNNSVQVTSTQGGTGNTSNASITVVSPPLISKVFGAASIPLNGATSLSFTIQNSNATSLLSGVAFSDTLPAGLVISTPNGLTGSCGGGLITAPAGNSAVGLSGAALSQSGSCNFSVNVTGTAAGQLNNTTSAVTSIEGGTGGSASASLSVVAPPSIAKAFNPAVVALNGISTVTFTLTNPAANSLAEAGVAFTDSLPAGLLVASPNGLSNTCAGAATAVAGSTSISLTGGNIAVNTSCTFVVNITGTASGQYTNTTGAVSSANGGTGLTASANLTVANPPTIAKTFGAASLALGASTSLSFTITNSNSSVAFTGVAFNDNLPAGLVVSTPNGVTGACGSGAIVAVAATQSITLAGGTIPINSSCMFSINATAAVAGTQVNTTGSVSAANGGNGNTATASINVLAPDMTLSKSHAGSFFQGQIGAAYSLIATNIGAGPTLGTVTVTDNLPAGLTATAIAGTGWNCTLATLTCTRNDALAAAGSYAAIAVTVNVAPNAAASVTNNAIVAGGGELNLNNDAASDTTTVTLPPDFSLSAAIATVTVRAGRPASYLITITPLNNVFTNPVALTASGLPGKASVVFTSDPVTPGANPATSTLVVTTIQGDPYVARNSGTSRGPLFAMTLPFAGLLISGFGFRGRRLKKGWYLLAALLVCSGLGVYGCAGTEANFQNLGTPSGSYTVTITGISGTVQHSIAVTLIVQP